MNKNFKKIVSMVVLLAMVLSVVVIVPVAAADLQPLPDVADGAYNSGVFIVCRTIDEEGNPIVKEKKPRKSAEKKAPKTAKEPAEEKFEDDTITSDSSIADIIGGALNFDAE